MPLAIRADVPVRKLLIDCRCGRSKVSPGQLCAACKSSTAVSRENSTSRVLEHQQIRSELARERFGE